jgi:lysylphosphatidylglycerol synthetase-like protein (DUF2156 family)
MMVVNIMVVVVVMVVMMVTMVIMMIMVVIMMIMVVVVTACEHQETTASTNCSIERPSSRAYWRCSSTLTGGSGCIHLGRAARTRRTYLRSYWTELSWTIRTLVVVNLTGFKLNLIQVFIRDIKTKYYKKSAQWK